MGCDGPGACRKFSGIAGTVVRTAGAPVTLARMTGERDGCREAPVSIWTIGRRGHQRENEDAESD